MMESYIEARTTMKIKTTSNHPGRKVEINCNWKYKSINISIVLLPRRFQNQSLNLNWKVGKKNFFPKGGKGRECESG